MKSTYCEYILENILSTSEVGPILALIAPSPLQIIEKIYFLFIALCMKRDHCVIFRRNKLTPVKRMLLESM